MSKAPNQVLYYSIGPEFLRSNCPGMNHVTYSVIKYLSIKLIIFLSFQAFKYSVFQAIIQLFNKPINQPINKSANEPLSQFCVSLMSYGRNEVLLYSANALFKPLNNEAFR